MAPYPFKTAFGTQYQNVEVNIDESAEITKYKLKGIAFKVQFASVSKSVTAPLLFRK